MHDLQRSCAPHGTTPAGGPCARAERESRPASQCKRRRTARKQACAPGRYTALRCRHSAHQLCAPPAAQQPRRRLLRGTGVGPGQAPGKRGADHQQFGQLLPAGRRPARGGGARAARAAHAWQHAGAAAEPAARSEGSTFRSEERSWHAGAVGRLHRGGGWRSVPRERAALTWTRGRLG